MNDTNEIYYCHTCGKIVEFEDVIICEECQLKKLTAEIEVKHIVAVGKIASKLGYPFEVTAENVKEIIVALAENHAEELESDLNHRYDVAVRQWSFGNDGTISKAGREAFRYNYDIISGIADKILSYLGIVTDYPGLKPSFTITVDGNKYGEYSIKNALRRFNHFWK